MHVTAIPTQSSNQPGKRPQMVLFLPEPLKRPVALAAVVGSIWAPRAALAGPAALRALQVIPTGMSRLNENYPTVVGVGSCFKAQKCRKQARRCLVPGRALASFSAGSRQSCQAGICCTPLKDKA